MAHGSYLLKRDGRYYVKVRKSRFWAKLSGQQMYRRSLQTSDVREARQALTPYLKWIWQMNDMGAEYGSTFDLDFERKIYLLSKYKSMMQKYLDYPVYNDPNELRAREGLEHEIGKYENKVNAELNKINGVGILCPGFIKTRVEFSFANIRYREKLDEELENYRNSDTSDVEQNRRTNSPESAQRHTETESPQAVYQQGNPVNTFGHTSSNATSFEPASSNLDKEITQPTAMQAENPIVSIRLSEALELCLDAEKDKKGDDRQRSVVKPVVDFIVYCLNDPEIQNITPQDIRDVVVKLPLIPKIDGVPKAYRLSFAKRYEYGQQEITKNGKKKKRLNNLTRLTKSTIDGRYLVGIRVLLNYLKNSRDWPHEIPVLSVQSGELMASLPRDAFDDTEIEKIFTQPLFTGCMGINNVWNPGKYFLQSGLYWGYLISLLAGMRQGEIAQLACSDLKYIKGHWHFDLTPFEAADGRVPLKEVKKFKTSGSARVIPVHPILIELGLLDRRDELEKLSCPRLFPDLFPLHRKNGDVRWGHPLTKSYQYLRKKIGLDRANVTLYSMRHNYAAGLDELSLSSRDRYRLMGHETGNAANVYGANNNLGLQQLEKMKNINFELINKISGALLDAKKRADRGELTILNPYLSLSNWASVDKAKLDKRKTR